MMSLNKILLMILLVLLTARSVMAEVIRWPQVCSSGELHVKNLTSSEVRGWLQRFKPTLLSETEYVFPPQALTKVNIKLENAAETFSLLHFKNQNALDVSMTCAGKVFTAHSFEGGRLTFRRSDLAQNVFYAQNLFSADNTLQIEFLDRRQQVLATTSLKLKSLARTVYQVPTMTQNWFYMRVQAQHRFAGFNMNSRGSEGPFILASQPSQVALDGTYFIVGSRSNPGDTFTIKVTDPQMVAKAREQIQNPNLEKIVFAKIQKGHSGFNRNWAKKEKSFWSWSTLEVTNISDLGSTSCNGLPQAVEDRMDSWVKNPGRICFWSYRILKELKPSEVSQGEIIQ